MCRFCRTVLDPADETCREYERVLDAKYLDQIRTEAKQFSTRSQSDIVREAIYRQLPRT
jgi:hypothetical protein